MGPGTRRLVLEIDAIADSLAGRVTAASGETRQFTGWIGLFGALEALLPAPEPDRAARETTRE
jgi:hypothetical protein